MEPGTGELDALLAAIETSIEGGRYLHIPVTPTVVRWLLRGEFVRDDGGRARMVGGRLRGDEFVPTFESVDDMVGAAG